MDVETLGIRGQTRREFHQLLARDACRLLVLRFIAASEVVVPILWKIAHQRLLGELRSALLRGFVLALDGPYALRNIFDTDLFGVNLIQWRMLFDRLVHQWLRHRGIVHLAM